MPTKCSKAFGGKELIPADQSGLPVQQTERDTFRGFPSLEHALCLLYRIQLQPFLPIPGSSVELQQPDGIRYPPPA